MKPWGPAWGGGDARRRKHPGRGFLTTGGTRQDTGWTRQKNTSRLNPPSAAMQTREAPACLE